MAGEGVHGQCLKLGLKTTITMKTILDLISLAIRLDLKEAVAVKVKTSIQRVKVN